MEHSCHSRTWPPCRLTAAMPHRRLVEEKICGMAFGDLHTLGMVTQTPSNSTCRLLPLYRRHASGFRDPCPLVHGRTVMKERRGSAKEFRMILLTTRRRRSDEPATTAVRECGSAWPNPRRRSPPTIQSGLEAFLWQRCGAAMGAVLLARHEGFRPRMSHSSRRTQTGIST